MRILIRFFSMVLLAVNAVFLTARDIPYLDPNSPEFHWMDELIEKDFAKLNPLTKKAIKQAIKQVRKNKPIIALCVKDNTVHGPKGAAYSMLEFLASRYTLPDLQLLYCQEDGLYCTPNGTVPIFTGARTNGVKNSILFVDWYFDIKRYVEWNQIIDLIDDELKHRTWNQRVPLLFWRGSPTDYTWPIMCEYTKDNWFLHTRGKACYLSLQFPDLIDAKFTRTFNYSVMQDSLTFSDHVSFEDHLNYKYQLQITGRMANFPRDRWQFYSESTVFRHPHPHEMYWYDLIQPWIHYIPVKSDLSDLVEKIIWAKQNDSECQKIAKNGREFAVTHFMPEHIALYCYKVLLKYVSLIQ
jgi:hypothetical protein